MKLATVFLAVALASASVIFCWQYRQAQDELGTERTIKSKLATELEGVQDRLSSQQTRLGVLEGEAQAREAALVQAATALTTVQGDLEQTRQELEGARREAKAARDEVQEQGIRIAQLEAERGGLSQEMGALSWSLEVLNEQIEETKQKLRSAQGDRGFLLVELKRLQGEKEGVLRQFNDMQALRMQLAKLREEAAIERRLDWQRRGIYARHERKGAELLVLKALPPVMPPVNPRLDVEFRQEGGAEIVPSPADPAGAQP